MDWDVSPYEDSANHVCSFCGNCKKSIDNLQEITHEEWNDILPVLKDTTKKIDKALKPIGHDISIPVGRAGGKNANHFYMRVVPKYKEGYVW